MRKTKKLALMAALTAIALTIFVAEAQIPPVVPIPGAKLGLANIVTLVAIVLMGVFGPPTGVWATILKPVLYWFPASTTGSVYSFGYTLFVGIIFNFIVGVTASRLMLKSISRFKFLRKPWLLGGKRA